MKLVEVVRTDATDPAVFEAGKKWVASIDRTSVSCKDTPGFIVVSYRCAVDASSRVHTSPLRPRFTIHTEQAAGT